MEIAHPPTIILDNSMMIFFSEDRSTTLTGSTQTDTKPAPRNIAFITVPTNFANSTEVNSEIGSRVWLTNYTIDTLDAAQWEHVMRIKAAKIKQNIILLVYEVWGQTEYIRTDFMTIDSNGAILASPQQMPYPLRLSPTDSMELSSAQHIFFGTDYTGTKMIRFHLKKVPKKREPEDCTILALFDVFVDFFVDIFNSIFGS